MSLTPSSLLGRSPQIAPNETSKSESFFLLLPFLCETYTTQQGPRRPRYTSSSPAPVHCLTITPTAVDAAVTQAGLSRPSLSAPLDRALAWCNLIVPFLSRDLLHPSLLHTSAAHSLNQFLTFTPRCPTLSRTRGDYSTTHIRRGC